MERKTPTHAELRPGDRVVIKAEFMMMLDEGGPERDSVGVIEAVHPAAPGDPVGDVVDVRFTPDHVHTGLRASAVRRLTDI